MVLGSFFWSHQFATWFLCFPPRSCAFRVRVRALQRARLAHTRNVQRESLKQMKLGQLTSRAGIWLREVVIRALPPSVLQKKLRASNVFDIGPWLDRFRVLKAQRRQGYGGYSLGGYTLPDAK